MSETNAVEILIVEDTEEDLQLTLRALRKGNITNRIQVARDGEEALEFLFCEGAYADRKIGNSPKVILLDIKLPKVDGLEVLQRIKADPRTQAIPVVVLTSSKEQRDVVESYKLGVNSYIVKPVNFEGFVKSSRSWGCIGCSSINRLKSKDKMSQQLQLLLVEDNTADAELLLRELRRAQFDPQWQRVETEEHYLANLRPDLDLIISDFEMPEFSGLRALELLKERGFEIPFIIVSGTIGDEMAVAVIKQGATDYLLKDRITRLGIAVNRALTETRERRKRLRAEQALKLLSTCVSHLNDIVLITEAEPINEPGPKIVFVNEAFERLTGYTEAEALGHSPRFLQGEKTDPRIVTEIRKALAQQRPIRREIINYAKDGTEHWLDMDIVPIFDVAGKCTHFAAIERDVTAAKNSEEQLLWKTAFFEAQVNSALDGILVVNNEGHKILENQRMIDLWNLPGEINDEVDDGHRLEWVKSRIKHPQQFSEKVAYLYAHPDEISRDELELLDGRFFDRYSAPVLGRDGKNYGRIWSFRDITDRKRAEERITEQAALLDKARDAILVRDLEGKILFWNQGAERMYGWTSQEVIGRNIGEILYTNPKKFEEVNGLAISQGEWHGELPHLTRDRREITVEARWTLIRDNEGQPKSVLAINTDVTEKKKIEAQFMRAQRMESIGTLAGGVAHDLNNILAPIMMSIDILRLTATDPRARKILETIEVSAQRGANIVRQVLTFARGLEGERIEVQPKLLLKDLENIIKDTFPKNIRLQFSIPNDTWTILGDPTQVHQILLNLCVNARDAMPRGGSLTIRVENYVFDEQYAAMNLQAKAGRYVNISVTDSGTGMPPELIEKIFEPFFTTKELNKGTGLGLSTVMAIVKSHDGVIHVSSEPGKSTTFQVYLPAMETSSEARKEQSEAANLPRGNGELILVVDDEASILTITGQTLKAFGYRILTATDGADALGVYAEHKNEIAAVLTDMIMPVMDGPAMIHALMRMNPSVQIIVASGFDANGNVAKASGAGVKHFLTKPYTAATLLKTMRAILPPPQ